MVRSFTLCELSRRCQTLIPLGNPLRHLSGIFQAGTHFVQSVGFCFCCDYQWKMLLEQGRRQLPTVTGLGCDASMFSSQYIPCVFLYMLEFVPWLRYKWQTVESCIDSYITLYGRGVRLTLGPRLALDLCPSGHRATEHCAAQSLPPTAMSTSTSDPVASPIQCWPLLQIHCPAASLASWMDQLCRPDPACGPYL